MALQLGILPFAGVDIAVFELLKEQLILKYGHDIPSVGILGAGVTSSIIAQFVSYPLALVRTRMQGRPHHRQPTPPPIGAHS